jgi:hypothetical protein
LRNRRLGHALGAALAALLLVLTTSTTLSGCAALPAVGRGGRVYAVRIASLNGVPTAARGPRSHPACVVQVGDQVARVWLARPSRTQDQSPVVMEADAEALKEGVLLERSWGEAIVHEVTEAELAAGAALVYIPGLRTPTAVELRFEPIPRVSSRVN